MDFMRCTFFYLLHKYAVLGHYRGSKLRLIFSGFGKDLLG